MEIKARNLDKQVYEDYVQLQIEEMKVGTAERYPANLSGGEKKRVALLRALSAPRPKLLLLTSPYPVWTHPSRLRSSRLRRPSMPRSIQPCCA